MMHKVCSFKNGDAPKLLPGVGNFDACTNHAPGTHGCINHAAWTSVVDLEL